MQRPQLVLFDVNETLSDLSVLAARFERLGAAPELARVWFASVLRDGIALAAAGTSAPFAEIAVETLRGLLAPVVASNDLEDAVQQVLSTFTGLDVHPDVPAGVRVLADRGLRLVTLSNGSTSVAEGLLGRAGLADRFERLLSVEQAGVWKPAPGAYRYGLTECGASAAEAILVAVHPWDIDGAGRAGLATAWLNRDGARYPAFFRPADIEVGTLTGLAEVLG
jgi:2-haloacid dehalogenase